MSKNKTMVKVVLFSKDRKWHDWKELFLARVNRKDPELGRYFNLSKPYPLTKMEGSEEVVDEDKLKIKRRAYDELLMSMSNTTNDGKNSLPYCHLYKGQGWRRRCKKRIQETTREIQAKNIPGEGKAHGEVLFHNLQIQGRASPICV